MLRWASRILLILLIVVLSGVTTGLVLVWTQTRREYVAFEDRRAQTEQHLAELRREREAKEAYLRAFLNEPEFVERVIRDRMGYVEPGEVMFRFDNP
ncbi:MAG: septum formation initiator family protein [Puniceicoccaceae bacterium]